jgi:ABC-2 type transport system ATP-binding protein
MPGQEVEIKKRIGLVPDESLLFDRLTGLEFLEFVGRMYGLARPVAKERAAALIDLFELADAPRKLIAEYSKGMRKRAAMAASLIHHPICSLWTSPSKSGRSGARLMKDILLDQVRRGATIFLTSHVLEVVERLWIAWPSFATARWSSGRPMDDLRGFEKHWRMYSSAWWGRPRFRPPGLAVSLP